MNDDKTIYRAGFPSELEITRGMTISVMSGKSTKDGAELGFYPRDDYLLCEIYGSIPLYKVRKLVEEYIRKYSKPACIRGVGRGLQLAVTMAHLMKEDVGLWRTYFDTFTGIKRDGKKITGIQIVMMPIEVKE
ncbi:MAG: hypothetical protein ACTSRU_11035 [Candidatus Hodarchaeales archaeon]